MKKWIRLTAYLFLLASILSVLVSCNQKKTDPAPSGDTNVTTEAPDKTTEARQETTGAPSDDTTAPVDPSQKIDYAGQLKLDLDSETKKYEVTVRQYVDGDTTHFDVPEDISESGVLKARYLGVNTPESTGTIEKWGKQASNFTKEKLSSATSIYVESDDGNWNFDNTSSHRCLCWIWYKPQGVTTTHSDPHAKVTVDDAFKFPVRLTYAGRLDRDSEGLLLMTNDGDLINAMMRAGAGHEKEYIVRTRAKISDAQLHQMEKGVWLKDLQVKTRPCRIERLGDYSFRIVLTQGLNRQIRRMCASVGADIKVLKRVRVLCVTVKGLKPGMYRELNTQEKEQLYKEAFGNG